MLLSVKAALLLRPLFSFNLSKMQQPAVPAISVVPKHFGTFISYYFPETYEFLVLKTGLTQNRSDGWMCYCPAFAQCMPGGGGVAEGMALRYE